MKKKENPGVGSVGFKIGMQQLINRLEREIEGRIIKEAKTSLNHDINTIICTNAHDAASILSNCTEAQLLNKITYIPLTSVTLFLKEPIPSLKQSFGVLFPRKSGFNTLGILHNDDIFPERVFQKCWSYTFLIPSTDHVNDILEKDFRNFTGQDISNLILHKEIKVWAKALPLYDRRRFEVINQLRSQWSLKNVSLFGNYVDGIALRDLVGKSSLYS